MSKDLARVVREAERVGLVAEAHGAGAENFLVEKVAAARQARLGRLAMVTPLETGTRGRLMDD